MMKIIALVNKLDVNLSQRFGNEVILYSSQNKCALGNYHLDKFIPKVLNCIALSVFYGYPLSYHIIHV